MKRYDCAWTRVKTHQPSGTQEGDVLCHRRPVIIGCAVGGAVTAALLAAAAALLITRRRRRRLLAAATALEVSPDKPSLRSLHAFPVDGPPKALTGGSAGSGIGGRGDFKSTIDGSYVQFERTASGELCLLGQGKFGKVCTRSTLEFACPTVCVSEVHSKLCRWKPNPQ